MTSNPSELFTPFLPATYNVPEEDDQRKVFLVDKFSMIADVVNDKKIGSYTQVTENFNGEVWIYASTQKVRNGYQTIAYIPSYVPMTLTLTSSPQFPIANINSQFRVTLVYGTASKPCTAVGAGDGDYFSFMAQGDSRISFTMSDTQIVITTDGGRSAYSGQIVIHYLRDGA